LLRDLLRPGRHGRDPFDGFRARGP
jgi:hypothetical protein